MANSRRFTPLADPGPIIRGNIEVLRSRGKSDRLIAIELKLRNPEVWGLRIPKPKPRSNKPPQDGAPKPVLVTRRDPKTLLEERARRLRLARAEFERVKAAGEPTSIKAISRSIGVEPSFWGWRINQAKDETFIQFRDEIELWNKSLREQKQS